MMAELCNFNPGHGFIILLKVISLRAIRQGVILLQIESLILCRYAKGIQPEVDDRRITRFWLSGVIQPVPYLRIRPSDLCSGQ